MAFDYRTTIHTMEIKAHTTLNHKQFYSLYGDRSYLHEVKALGNGTYTMVVNPHKFKGTDVNGKYQFRYIPLSEHMTILDKIKQELQIDSLTVIRLDVCADPQIDYIYSEKALRLLVLLLSNEIGARNNYISYDPMTLEVKTIRVEARKGYNGRIYNGMLQVENYNRGLLNQIDYDSVVINRLEFRAAGTEAGENYSPGGIVDRWKARLKAVSDPLTLSQRIQEIEQTVNESLYSKWQQLVIMGKRQPTGKEFNDFIFYNLSSIYTRRQMVNLFCMCGDTEQKARIRAKNIRRLGKTIFKGQLLTEKQLAGEVESLISSFDKFNQI